SGKITIFKFHPDFKVFKSHGVVGTNSLVLIADFRSKKRFVEQYFIDETSEEGVRRALEEPSLLKSKSKYSKLAFGKLKDADWNVLSDDGGSPTVKNRCVTLDNGDYFDVFGGFQPPVARIADFEL